LGMAGIDWNGRILPVRALGQCGGTDEDILEATLWATGVPIAGVPPNPNPAKVVNLSLGGYGACASAVQEAFDGALAQGAVIVVAAGNESDDVNVFAPANCSGVITVGAHDRTGDRTFYSNFGRRIDISAPSGNGDDGDAMVSLSNTGVTTPADATYRNAVGTSFSAPMVSGTVSLMLARNPLLTAGQVLGILTGTARRFEQASPCRLGTLCGFGMLDSGAAVAATLSATAAPPADAIAVVEYYNARLDHYFITASAAEMAALDGASEWRRTGYLFYAYPDAGRAPASARPVCRFYASGDVRIDSHYFTASAEECAFVRRTWPGIWLLETPAAFYVQLPDASGSCPEGTLGVHRFFNNRRDANHRYTLDASVQRAMVNRSWIPEGDGPDAVVFCSPL